ncbi:F-actin-uncapping protein LRRC16A-like [Mercenaria mercenaria]|uniref:F-actin-uncapping protein LRRC16A-like n=1 Tax=Mercenaria mercenaria TaxID=6596 RepID=UPI00234EE246|nr:F-actin-uncapping protein LRRC16A-like [Mercenaria mercenaria]
MGEGAEHIFGALSSRGRRVTWDLLLGISANRNIKDVHLDISGIDLPAQGAQCFRVDIQTQILSMFSTLYLTITGFTDIDLINVLNTIYHTITGFTDTDLISVLNTIGQNKQIQQLSMGGVFKNIKPKNLKGVMEQLVEVLQDEESVIESVSLSDSKLRDSMNMIINALGSNTSLTEIDISGNQMGDLGARMLSKALQINNKLKTIIWDKNNTTSQGFEDVADALEKNFTLRKMPMPVHDASSNPEKAEQALQRIERLLQRNHSPQKYSSDQAYRLQQGFLISSTQQMVDRLVVQSQDTINALESMNALQPCSGDVETAKSLITDADNSKTLLPRLHDIAIQSQNTNSPVAQKLKEISVELTKVLESQMKKTVQDMLEATTKQCKALMKDQAFLSDLQSGCGEKSALPKDFTSNILNDVDTDIFNKLSELNLAVAAHVSDRVIDEVIERLSFSHKTLTNHLNERKKDAGRRSQVTESKKLDQNEANIRSKSPQPILHTLHVEAFRDSPKMKDKRKSMHARKIRPQSVVDRDHIRLALDAEKTRPTTVPQATRTGSRSPKNRSPKSPRAKDKSQEKENLKTETVPKKAPRSLKPTSRSPNASPRSNSPVPTISVTYTDVGNLDQGHDPLYDNVTPDRRHKKHSGDERGLRGLYDMSLNVVNVECGLQNII